MRGCRSLFLFFALTWAIAAPAVAQGRATGVVKAEGGQPIKGASVTAENPDAIPSSFTATTDDRGRFAILGLRPGIWTFTAQAPGFAPSQNRARVQSTLTRGTELEFVLPRGAGTRSGSMLAGVNMTDLQTMLDKADTLYSAGEYDQAIAAYQGVLQKAPALTAVHLQIGHAYRQKKDSDRALAKYQEALKLGGSGEKARIAIATVNIEKGELDAAAAVLSAGTEEPNPTGELFYQLGDVKVLQKRPEEAIAWYERAHASEPTWGKPLLRLGAMALEAGDTARARQYLEQLLQTDPSSPEAAQAKVLMEQVRRQ